MMRWFEETRRRRLADATELRDDGPLRGAQPDRRRRRSPAASTSSCAATCCSISRPTCAARAFDRLAAALAPDGALMLGAGETVIGQTERFVSDPECRGLYCSAPAPRRLTRVADDRVA